MHNMCYNYDKHIDNSRGYFNYNTFIDFYRML